MPAGAVGLAGAFSGIYPRPSPGGWQIIGQTDAVLWDVHRDPPALLRPGATVQFVDIEADPGGDPEPGGDAEPGGGADPDRDAEPTSAGMP